MARNGHGWWLSRERLLLGNGGKRRRKRNGRCNVHRRGGRNHPPRASNYLGELRTTMASQRTSDRRERAERRKLGERRKPSEGRCAIFEVCRSMLHLALIAR